MRSYRFDTLTSGASARRVDTPIFVIYRHQEDSMPSPEGASALLTATSIIVGAAAIVFRFRPSSDFSLRHPRITRLILGYSVLSVMLSYLFSILYLIEIEYPQLISIITGREIFVAAAGTLAQIPIMVFVAYYLEAPKRERE